MTAGLVTCSSQRDKRCCNLLNYILNILAIHRAHLAGEITALDDLMCVSAVKAPGASSQALGCW